MIKNFRISPASGIQSFLASDTGAADVVTTAEFKITGFKVEQRITNFTSDNSIDAGGFANGQSNIKKFDSQYQVMLFSDKFKVVQGTGGRLIKKRYGYGYGFTIAVIDIQTKVKFNYAIIAASVTLNKAKANYKLIVNGVKDAALFANAPADSGKFTADIYESLIKFIAEANKYLTTNTTNVLYPIELFQPGNISSEVGEYKSIYYAVKRIKQGLTLKNTIDQVKKDNLSINQNVVLFIYKYFGITDAYTEPSSNQKTNADNWIWGDYNKVSDGLTSDSWVAIDPALEDGKFIVLSGTPMADDYKPHPVPHDWKDMAKTMQYEVTTVSMDFSSELKIAAILDTSSSFNTTTITRDLVLYADVSDPLPGSKVIETRYGIGARLIMKISQVEFGTEVNYGTIGAISEMGFANVEYEISALGISDKGILSILPGPQIISENTIKSIESAFSEIKTKISTLNMSDVIPQPFMIRVEEPGKIDPTLEAQGVVYGYRKIKENKSLTDAKKAASVANINVKGIEYVYTKVFGLDATTEPARKQRNEAEAWLNF